MDKAADETAGDFPDQKSELEFGISNFELISNCDATVCLSGA